MTLYRTSPDSRGSSPGSNPRTAALEEGRRLTEPALRAALDRLEPHTRRVCGYHFGYWDAYGTPGTGGGKGLRPALALLSARSTGAPAAAGVPAAAACELVHNFSLLHDDVMDRDTERRHRPTVWAHFGTSTAILAGDALLALASEVLSAADSPTVPWAVRCLTAATRRLIAGQTADLAFESTEIVSLQRCLQMSRDKTGALMSCAASLGAVLADGPARLTLGLADYGAHVGLAFQLTDDLLGIWGDPERTGKPVWSDLRARKKSVPVVAAMQSGTVPGDKLRRLYGNGRELADSELEGAAQLVERAGGRTWTEDAIARESAAAISVLDALRLPSQVHDELVALTNLLSGREH